VGNATSDLGGGSRKEEEAPVGRLRRVDRSAESVEPDTLDEIRHAAGHVPRVEEVTDVRARWVGHRLHAEVSGVS